MKGYLTISQRKGLATRKARAHRRLCVIRDCSNEGLSKADAAKRAGLSLAGVNSLLSRELGSTAWPMPEHSA